MTALYTENEPAIALGRFETFATGLDHPECVNRTPTGDMYAGGEAGQIYKVELGGEWQQVASTEGFILGVAVDGDGNVYACDYKHSAVFRIAAGSHEVDIYSSGTASRPMTQPNYAAFDDNGNLYVSDSGTWEAGDGCLWVIRAGGKTELLTDEVTAYPNGIALDPQREFLYIVLSNLPGVVKLPVSDGVATGRATTVVELPDTVPDGIAFDQDGNLYVSCFAPDLLLRLAPSGELSTVAYDPSHSVLCSPANLTFCGLERTTLVVSNFGAWHLSKVTIDIPGDQLSYPRGVSAPHAP